MNHKIKGLILLICAALAALMTVVFFSRSTPIEAQMPLVTRQMIDENQAEIQKQEQLRQSSAAARRRAELENRLYQCQSGEECIIVDKDPCGCLKGPEGVTAINSAMSLDFSRAMEKQFAAATACPSAGSTERECSPSARAVCEQNRCKIVY